MPFSANKQAETDHVQRYAKEREHWIQSNQYFYEDHYRYLRFLIPSGSYVLDLGCGIGDVLHALEPSHGVGVDLSTDLIATAVRKYPAMEFHVGDIATYKDKEAVFLYTFELLEPAESWGHRRLLTISDEMKQLVENRIF